ncbi:MAG: PBP1A family penicillin-binding protein [Alphaproteobacteria bacterium]|nr:PBP1A family penicillin-binding protein [Alphaproteobacteria bacterium]
MARSSRRRSSRSIGQKISFLFSRAGFAFLFAKAWRAVVLLMIWGFVAGGGLIAWYAYDMPDIRQVAQPERRPAITLLADDGTVFKRYGDLYGQRVTIKDVPVNLVNAIMAIEDRRFYSHFGIDVFGLLRALVSNVIAGHVVQGGSTITQQLAKNLFLTPQRTTRRKVQEMLLAFWLEHTYTKDQILTAYLNRVYLGSGAYGVDAAADIYFGKPVSALNLRECALIAGLLRAPSRYAPTNDPVQALERAKTVLGAMVDADYITEAEKNSAIDDVPMPRRKPGAGGDGHYYADWIVDQVMALLENAPQDVVVLTTIDLKLQRIAERKLDGVLASEGASKKVEEGALVAMTTDGAVRAMVGGRDYGESQFNRATQAMRQPGSSFKPVIYLAALLQGMRPDDTFEDAPIRIGKWTPENYDGKYHGTVSARDALAKSLNTVAVRMMQNVGVSKVINTARMLGVTSDLGADLSLALGTNLVTPLELTGVYAALATGGRAVTPYGIKEIRSRDGKILYHRDDVTFPVTVNPQAVATLVDMMTGVVTYGTGKRAALDRPVAGKTGTSSDYRDAWFLGFTGDYVTGVWVGNDDNKPMKKVTGGSLPAGLWHDFMVEAEAGKPVRSLLPDVIVPAQPSVEVFSDEPLAAPEPSSANKLDALGDFIKGLARDLPTEVEHSYPAQ